MVRYKGEDLPTKARIAVLSNDAIGNFVAATPLLQMLRAKWPQSEITYFGGTRTAELECASDLFDHRWPLHGTQPRETAAHVLAQQPFDLVVNNEQSSLARAAAALISGDSGFVVGPCLSADGRGDLPYADDWAGKLAEDKEWIHADVCLRHPKLSSPFIGEIFCRLAYLEGEFPLYKVPVADPPSGLPPVLIATSASLESKLWPFEKWKAVLEALRAAGHEAGLIGAKPKEQGKHWKGSDAETMLVEQGLVHDLRGTMSLPQVVGALGKAQVVLTLDNGILHLAAASGSPVIGLFRFGIHRLWAPPYKNLTVVHAFEGDVVANIPPEPVLEALWRAL